MRKLFGLFFAFVAMFFLAMAYSRLARAVEPTCDSVLATRIAELVKQDKSKILDMQFELTTLKLASETLKANRKTVEGYIRTQETTIAKLDDRGIREKLRVLYQRSGEAADAERIRTALQESVEKAKKGRYVEKALRFKNKDLSAYVLAHALSEGKSIYDQNDVSILWLRSEISEGVEKATYRGSAPANMQEASTLVARLTGMAGTTAASKEEIGRRIEALQQVIGAELDQIATTFTNDQRKACAEIATCDNCQVSDEHKAAGLSKALQAIGQKLVTDDAAREEAVRKVTAGLKKERPEIELEPDGGDDADIKIKTKTREPSAPPTSTPSGTPSSRPGPARDSSAKEAPPVALTGDAELGKAYAIDVKDTILKKCAGSMSFVQEGNDLKLKFTVVDGKTSEVVCEGAYVVRTKRASAWDDTSAQAECKKQDISLVQACFE